MRTFRPVLAVLALGPVRSSRRRPGTDPLGPHAGHLARRQARRLQLPRRHLGRRGHRRHRPAGHLAPRPRHRPRSSAPTAACIAFSSNRHGSYNVFVVPVQGGTPRRLTFDSDNDLVTGWSPDGKQVLFASTRSVAFPPSFELYTVPVEGGMAHRVSADDGKEGVFSPDGDAHRLRARPRRLVSQGLSRLVQRRHLDLRRRRHAQPPAHQLRRPGRLAHVERRRQVDLLCQRILRHAGQHRPHVRPRRSATPTPPR